MANNTFQEKELKTKWPVVTGLTAVSKHEDREENLKADQGSNVPRRYKAGISGL